jgi:hypothetical protein
MGFKQSMIHCDMDNGCRQCNGVRMHSRHNLDGSQLLRASEQGMQRAGSLPSSGPGFGV